ncbi:MAG: hypothetical protein ACLQLH_04075 [Terracidiphilus sp.]
MPVLNRSKSDAENAADIIRDAGGKIVGKTRLQKIAYLLEISELGCGFSFEYRHYGPFSEDLANAVVIAQFADLITEEDHTASWGGSYSIFRTKSGPTNSNINPARKRILELGMEANPISLELAATAAFLAKEGNSDAWEETRRRKPEKAKKWLKEARVLFASLKSVKNIPNKWPSI